MKFNGCCGKTKTAKYKVPKTGLFASIAPLDNPRFVVAVDIKDSEANGLPAVEIALTIYFFLRRGSYHLVKFIKRAFQRLNPDGCAARMQINS